MGNAYRNQKNNDNALQGRYSLMTIIMRSMIFAFAIAGLGVLWIFLIS